MNGSFSRAKRSATEPLSLEKAGKDLSQLSPETKLTRSGGHRADDKTWFGSYVSISGGRPRRPEPLRVVFDTGNTEPEGWERFNYPTGSRSIKLDFSRLQLDARKRDVHGTMLPTEREAELLAHFLIKFCQWGDPSISKGVRHSTFYRSFGGDGDARYDALCNIGVIEQGRSGVHPTEVFRSELRVKLQELLSWAEDYLKFRKQKAQRKLGNALIHLSKQLTLRLES
jgi:hypothetical protein